MQFYHAKDLPSSISMATRNRTGKVGGMSQCLNHHFPLKCRAEKKLCFGEINEINTNKQRNKFGYSAKGFTAIIFVPFLMWSMTRGTSRSIISTRTRNMSCVFPTKDFSSRVFGSLPIAITYVRVPMSWIGFMTSLRGFTSSPWACRPVVSSTRIFKESESVCLSMPSASSRARSILLFPIWENSNLKFYIKFDLAVNVAVIRLPVSSLEGGCNVQAFGFYIISSCFFFYVQLTTFGNF